MSVKRYDVWGDMSGEDYHVEAPRGKYVLYADYASLHEAKTELSEGLHEALKQRDALQDKVNVAVEALESFRRKGHSECDDPWYSCPKSEEGCADDSKAGGPCDCGTDWINAKIDQALAKLKGMP